MAFWTGVVVAHIEGESVNGLGPALEDGGGNSGQFVGAASGPAAGARASTVRC